MSRRFSLHSLEANTHTQMRFSFLTFLLFGGCVLGLRRTQQCGLPVPHGKIVGGVDSGGYQYPWFALLLLKRNAFLPVPVCAGTLITELFVLTAAHCFSISSSVENQNLYTVALGVYDICDDKEETRQVFNMAAVAVHENYQKRGKFYDIALIKLDRPAIYAVICLPISGVSDITEQALLIGFGVTSENSNFTPCHLLEANVTKFSKMDCSSSKLPAEDKAEESVICAGALSGAVDSCYGDSGGPLQTRLPDGRFVIAGIVSYGYGCGVPDVPGVYTNVGSYIQWINSKISALSSKKVVNKQSKPTSRGIFRRHNTSVLFPGNTSSKSTRHFYQGKKSIKRIIHFKEDNVKNRTSGTKRVVFP